MQTIEEVTKDIANYWIHNLSNSEIKTADDECNYLKKLLNEIIEIHKAEKRPKGKWISHQFEKGNKSIDEDTCSICGEQSEQIARTGQAFKYCPNCGADMRESEEK